MMRILLALLIAAAWAQVPTGEPPVNLRERPGLVNEADRGLLTGRGYRLDDGFVRLGSEPPLGETRLKQVLAELMDEAREVKDEKEDRPDGSLGLKDAVASLPALGVSALEPSGVERVKVVIQNVRRSLDDAGGAPASFTSLFDGPPAQAAVFLEQAAARVAGRASAGRPVVVSLASRPAVVRPSFFSLRPALLAEAPAGVIQVQARQNPPSPPRVPTPAPAPAPAPAPTPNPKAPSGRLASLFLSEDLLNQVIKDTLQFESFKDLSLAFDAVQGKIVARGLFKVPAASLRSLNLDGAKVPDFKFQMTIEPKTTKEGFLILVFPLQETFFHPADSKDPVRDRVVVPVQFLELALASIRGYLGVLSGDYSAFDRKAAALLQDMSRLDGLIARAKDPDKKEELADERAKLSLALQGIPIERRQAQRMAKRLGSVLGFVSERDIRLNDDLSAERNTVILKLKLDRLAPFLKGIQLGGIRVLMDTRDGSGERYLAIDLIKAVP